MGSLVIQALLPVVWVATVDQVLFPVLVDWCLVLVVCTLEHSPVLEV